MTNKEQAKEILNKINERIENMNHRERKNYLRGLECNFTNPRYDRFLDVHFEFVNILNTILFKDCLIEFKTLIGVQTLNPRPWLIEYLKHKIYRLG